MNTRIETQNNEATTIAYNNTICKRVLFLCWFLNEKGEARMIDEDRRNMPLNMVDARCAAFARETGGMCQAFADDRKVAQHGEFNEPL